MNILFMATVLVMILFAPDTQAACIWQHECDAWGNCRQVPICDSALDIVPVRPPALAPIPAPTIRPIQRPTLPPLGTSSCRQAYLCSMGNCRWQTVCR